MYIHRERERETERNRERERDTPPAGLRRAGLQANVVTYSGRATILIVILIVITMIIA